eukprot:gb/GFBE01010946.1/.p1 GENE.gb/GFBE01010946.1/~~gb/GFBE01010946.1/.p1  ORF type:complete len:247 (+),score=34.97 gb/GFBE01010946.1/:1-741(+)
MARAGWVLALHLVSFASTVAGQEGHADILIDQLNYNALTSEESSKLVTVIANAIANAVGVPPNEVLDLSRTASSVSLQAGTAKNAWIPESWPQEEDGYGTLATAVLELPSSVAFLAEQTLGSPAFESKLRKEVKDALGESTAILGQLNIKAVSVSQPPQIDTDADAITVPETGTGEKQMILYAAIAAGAVVLIVIVVCICRCLCGGIKQPRNTSGFLEVNQYDDDGVPIYEDPMKLFRPRGNQYGH